MNWDLVINRGRWDSLIYSFHTQYNTISSAFIIPSLNKFYINSLDLT